MLQKSSPLQGCETSHVKLNGVGLLLFKFHVFVGMTKTEMRLAAHHSLLIAWSRLHYDQHPLAIISIPASSQHTAMKYFGSENP